MKKISVVLLVVMLICAFAACSPAATPTPTQAPSPTVQVTPTPKPTTPVVPTQTPRPVSPQIFQGGWELLDDVTGKSYITVTPTQILSYDGDTLLSTKDYVVKSAAYDAGSNMVVTLDGDGTVYTIFKSKAGYDFGAYSYMEINMGSSVIKMVRMK